MSNVEVRQAIVQDNYRMTAPDGCPLICRRVMYLGWHRLPSRRPMCEGE